MADDNTDAAICQQQEPTEAASVQQQQKQDSSALREEQEQSVQPPVEEEVRPELAESGVRNEQPPEARGEPEQQIQRPGANSIPPSMERNGRGNRVVERNNSQQIQQQQHLLLGVRDRLFHALFYRVAMAYARAVPQHCRVILEYFALFKVKLGFSCHCLQLQLLKYSNTVPLYIKLCHYT